MLLCHMRSSYSASPPSPDPDGSSFPSAFALRSYQDQFLGSSRVDLSTRDYRSLRELSWLQLEFGIPVPYHLIERGLYFRTNQSPGHLESKHAEPAESEAYMFRLQAKMALVARYSKLIVDPDGALRPSRPIHEMRGENGLETELTHWNIKPEADFPAPSGNTRAFC